MSNQKTIKASEFKAKCLKLIDKVSVSGEELVITKNQKPVAKLTPYTKKPASLYGIYEDKIKITGNIIAPTGVEWNAMTGGGWDDLLGYF